MGTDAWPSSRCMSEGPYITKRPQNKQVLQNKKQRITGRTRPKLLELDPTSVETSRTVEKPTRRCSKPSQFRPKLGNIGRKSPKFARAQPQFCRTRPSLGETNDSRSNETQVGCPRPEVGRTRPNPGGANIYVAYRLYTMYPSSRHQLSLQPPRRWVDVCVNDIVSTHVHVLTSLVSRPRVAIRHLVGIESAASRQLQGRWLRRWGGLVDMCEDLTAHSHERGRAEPQSLRNGGGVGRAPVDLAWRDETQLGMALPGLLAHMFQFPLEIWSVGLFLKIPKS